MDSKEASTVGDEKAVSFTYLKSPFHRVIHVDGAIGALTPSGDIHMALYSERQAIPQIMHHTVSPSGQLGDVVGQEGRPGYVRELDVSAMISPTAARALIIWLAERLEELESKLAQKVQKEERE